MIYNYDLQQPEPPLSVSGRSNKEAMFNAANKALDLHVSYFAVVRKGFEEEDGKKIYKIYFYPLFAKDVAWAKDQGYFIYNTQHSYNFYNERNQ